MTCIAVSGASGDLGRRITAELLTRIDPWRLTLVTRTPGRLADRVTQGVKVCQGDYNSPDLLEAAYRGCDTLMLISGLDVTKRVPEHRNAINAAIRAGVRHIVYTSVAGIHPRNPTPSASDHIVTEADLRSSGLSHVILRNATYAEIFPTIAALPVRRTGVWTQTIGDGRLAPVSKRDIARCAATCLLDPAGHNGAVYEISGPELVSFRQIAAMVAETYDIPVDYQAVTVEERYAQLDALGVPRRFTKDMSSHPDAHLWCSEEMVTADVAFQLGFHAVMSDHVKYITGRMPHPLREIFALCKDKDYENC